jgi:hypothetical protein
VRDGAAVFFRPSASGTPHSVSRLPRSLHCFSRASFAGSEPHLKKIRL